MQNAKLLQYGQLSILVVDDQAMVRALLVRALKALGFAQARIYQASDGMAALVTLSTFCVDAILSDVDMAPMGGLDLLKAVRMGRAHATPSTIPFIFVSGSSGGHVSEGVEQLDADGFIVKPPKADDIEQSLLAAFLRPRPGADPLRYTQVSTGTEYDRTGVFWHGTEDSELAGGEGSALAANQGCPAPNHTEKTPRNT